MSAYCEYMYICGSIFGHALLVELIYKPKNTIGFLNERMRAIVIGIDLLSIWHYCKCDNSKLACRILCLLR